MSYAIVLTTFVLVNIAIMVPGQLVVKNKVMSKSNTKLLNNLKESVIIEVRAL